MCFAPLFLLREKVDDQVLDFLSTTGSIRFLSFGSRFIFYE